MKIVSWNCGGWSLGGFDAKKMQIISASSPDILVIQEITKTEFDFLKSLWTYKNWYGDDQEDTNQGIAIFSNKFSLEFSDNFNRNFRLVVPYCIKDISGKIEPFILFAVWTKGKPIAYEQNLYEALKYYGPFKDNTIIIGDFNTFAKNDNQRLSEQNSKLQSYGLHNCAEGKNAELPTFRSPKFGEGTDDFCYATEQIVKPEFSVLSEGSGFDNLSDHCPISVDFDL